MIYYAIKSNIDNKYFNFSRLKYNPHTDFWTKFSLENLTNDQYLAKKLKDNYSNTELETIYISFIDWMS